MSLTIGHRVRVESTIIDAILERNHHNALVFTPHSDDVGDDGELFVKVKHVANWGWLRRQACGYGEPNLLSPSVGVAFTVRTWRYGKSRHLGMNGTGPLYLDHERFDGCILIARLSDGRIFADQWADRSVLYDALDRWRNAQGCLVDWQPIGTDYVPTCAIGGLDWATIPGVIDGERARQRRELERVT